MREAVYRAIRTFLQAWIGVFLAMTVSGDAVPDAGLLRRAAIAAAWAGVVALLSWLQNFLEEQGTVPKVLK